MHGIAPAQIPDAKISVCHGVGGMTRAAKHYGKMRMFLLRRINQ